MWTLRRVTLQLPGTPHPHPHPSVILSKTLCKFYGVASLFSGLKVLLSLGKLYYLSPTVEQCYSVFSVAGGHRTPEPRFLQSPPNTPSSLADTAVAKCSCESPMDPSRGTPSVCVPAGLPSRWIRILGLSALNSCSCFYGGLFKLAMNLNIHESAVVGTFSWDKFRVSISSSVFNK